MHKHPSTRERSTCSRARNRFLHRTIRFLGTRRIRNYRRPGLDRHHSRCRRIREHLWTKQPVKGRGHGVTDDERTNENAELVQWGLENVAANDLPSGV